MASFVNYGQTPQAENYSNRSRGVDVAGPNKALGTLFEGVGKVVDTAITTIDNNNILNINDELRTGIEAIRGAQGVDAAVNDPTVTGGETGGVRGTVSAPPGVASATSEIARINAAYKEGKIGDTYYYAKVESLARQVRNKYPGYRDEIDKKVSSIIGTNPANALRSSIISDLKQAQSGIQSRQNSDEAIIERGKEYLSAPQYQQFLTDKSPETINKLKLTIQQGELQKQTVSTAKQNYELKKARNEDTRDELTGLVTKDSSDMVWKIVSEGVDAAGGSLNINSLNKRIAEAASTGKAFSPEEVGALRQGFAALRSQASIAVDRLHSSSWGKNGQFSYQGEVRDPGKLAAIKAQAMAPIDAMEKALNDKDFGMFSYYANQSKTMKDEALQGIYARSNAVRNLAAANEALGPALGQILISEGLIAKAGSEVAKALNLDGTIKSLSGTDNGLNIIKQRVTEAKATKGDRAAQEYLTGQMNDATKILGSKTPNPTAIANSAKTWFNTDFNFLTDKDVLTPASRQKVLQMFSAPEIVDNLSKIKGTAPEAWSSYKSWLESSTKATFNGLVSQLAGWQSNPQGSGLQVVIDPQGRVSISAAKMSQPGGYIGDQSLRENTVTQLAKPLAQFNTALEARRRAAKEDGMDPNAAGLQFLQSLGLTVPVKEAAKDGDAPLAVEEVAVSPASLTSADRKELLEIESGDDQIDLEARDIRRSGARYNSDPNWQKAGENLAFTPDLRTGITQAAQELGVSPEDLATVISYETGGTFNPGIRGGAGNRHIGLIQFGPTEQAMYGASQDQTPGEQLKAVVKYLKHRGFQPGMDVLDLYSTINAGRPGRYNASDAGNGGAPGSVRDKVQNQMAGHRAKARRLLAGD